MGVETGYGGLTAPDTSAGISSRRAVIDIGSNSVRLVIFEGPPRAPFAIVNDKALCGLGRDIAVDGSIESAAFNSAIDTLRRFRRLLDAYGSPPTFAVATAAVRAATNSADFVGAARAVGVEVEIIDGAREAELAALGVISFEPRASGLIGDMGGGSLELIRVRDGALGGAVSLPLGAFALMRAAEGKVANAADIVARAFVEAGGNFDAPSDVLYAVGGAWRAIARLHMRHRNYPLQILHEYAIARTDVLDICAFVAGQSRESLSSLDGVPRRRIDALPYAALVMSAVVRAAGAKKVVVSAGGLREGLIYDSLPSAERAKDPLIVAAEFFASRLSPAGAGGEGALRVIAPLFDGDPAYDGRIAQAACLLMDAASYYHPDARGRQAFGGAMRASFNGVSHPERVKLALALYARHQGARLDPASDRVDALLDEDERRFAVRLGLAMRFIASLAPKAPLALGVARLRRQDGAVVFEAPRDVADLMQETAQKRLASLAEAFDAQPRVEVAPATAVGD